MPGLRDQYATPALPSTKIRLSILSTALIDALGGPPEFHKRFSFPLVTTMTPNHNFSLPPGVWTDDTSMTLCLARSLATYSPPNASSRGGFDEKHQLEAYMNWRNHGTLSAIGRCFDIGNTISRALNIYEQCAYEPPGSAVGPEDGLRRIREDLNGKNSAGNGSLMRILPVGLVYWRDEREAVLYAGRSSKTTHPTGICVEACEMWTGAIVRIMKATSGSQSYTKLELMDYIATFPYSNDKLRESLAVPTTAPLRPPDKEHLEEYYQTHHPILRLIGEMKAAPAAGPEVGSIRYKLPTQKQLPSTGYVLHTLVAALYCFFATRTFEEGAITAVNLGDDADTVGAVYAGLAGCWYTCEKGSKGASDFWSERVEEWRTMLVKRGLVEEVAEELAAFSESLGTV